MKRDPDVIALIACLDRLADDTLAAFRANPGTFTMCSASLQLESDEDDDVAPARRSKNKGNGFRRGTSDHRGNSGPSSSAVVHLIPNKDNNCFFNSALALVVSAFDGQPFPEIQTPAAHAFFTAAGILQDAMLTNAPLPPHVLVRSIYLNLCFLLYISESSSLYHHQTFNLSAESDTSNSTFLRHFAQIERHLRMPLWKLEMSFFGTLPCLVGDLRWER